MPFKAGQQLTPSEVYYAAVGMFLSDGYECTHTVESGIVGFAEFGRVFTRNGETHVLYFPGKDNDESFSASQTTVQLKLVVNQVNAFLEENKLNQVKNHIIVCENNLIGPFGAIEFLKAFSMLRRNHFVYVNQQGAYCDLYDSKSKKTAGLTYSLDLIKNILFPGFNAGHGAASLCKNYAGIQKGNWECGYYTLLSLEMRINDAAVKNLRKNIGDKLIERIKKMHELGFEFCRVNKSDSNDEGVDMPDDSEDDLKLASQNEISAPQPTKLATPSFWQTHRKTKYALTGLGIGLGILAIGVALAFAWPVVLPAVGGFIAAHIAIGALTTATVGWLGLAGAGVVATAVTTGVSMFAKWVKDKVSPKPMPDLVLPADPVKPRSRRSSTATATSTLSSMGTSTQELGDHLEAQVLKGNLTDSVVESVHPAEGGRLSLSAQPNQVGTLASPEEPESDSDDDFVDVPRKHKI